MALDRLPVRLNVILLFLQHVFVVNSLTDKILTILHKINSNHTLLSVQCNAWHWTDIKPLECLSVCLSVSAKPVVTTENDRKVR